ncbi:MAG: hypothetical protein GQ564_21725 [Bacteroidales bacterium]|nr:hypothetical protein [Bacteroidales bacterium]
MGLGDLLEVTGGLEKLIITAFEDKDYTDQKKSYVVMYNPTTYSLSISNYWLVEKHSNPDGKTEVFRGNKPDKVTFEFLFDATGASPAAEHKPGSGGSKTNKDLIGKGGTISALDLINKEEAGNRHVDEAIKEFFKLTTHTDGSTHLPSYLQLNWGNFEFRGVLDTATTNYKLFNSSGLPIRATVNATFAENVTKKEQQTDKGQTSPDITHVRLVEEGDTLPMLAKRIYGDPSFYLEIARINQLTNFRNLKKGKKIILPRLNKNANATN